MQTLREISFFRPQNDTSNNISTYFESCCVFGSYLRTPAVTLVSDVLLFSSVQCRFTSTETDGLLRTEGAQDGHLDFHTALCDVVVVVFLFFVFCQTHHCGAFIQKHSSIVTVFLSLTHSHVFVWFFPITCTSCTMALHLGYSVSNFRI